MSEETKKNDWENEKNDWGKCIGLHYTGVIVVIVVK